MSADLRGLIEQRPGPLFPVRGLQLDVDRRSLSRDGQHLTLRPQAMEVLCYLARNPGRTIPKDELFQEIFSRLGASNKLEKITNIDAYACRMAINLAFDWRRRRNRAPLPIDETAEPASLEKSVLDELIQDEDVEIILNGI